MTVPNYLSSQLLQLKSEQEIKCIIQDQDECLITCKETQQKLEAFNKFSQARYQQVHRHFDSHAKLLEQVKTDLNGVFSKLRNIKNQLYAKYPEEMKKVLEKYPPPELPDE